MTDMKDKKVRLILIGDRYYSGTITDEDELFYYLNDKFGKEVVIGKSKVISLEVIDGRG
ncbi:hypothetical protein [Lutibacter sp.]|uniref:hypothetical protein n=1 Tax=Lutibacter sp. TaxID=1925666 RepID=UPI0034A04FBF